MLVEAYSLVNGTPRYFPRWVHNARGLGAAVVLPRATGARLLMRRKGGVSRRYGAGLASRLAGGTYVSTALRIA